VDGAVVEDILREPGGRVIEYRAGAHRVVVVPSCQSLPGACSELVDPIAFYRDRIAHTSRRGSRRCGSAAGPPTG
jgi:hypothetical protein